MIIFSTKSDSSLKQMYKIEEINDFFYNLFQNKESGEINYIF